MGRMSKEKGARIEREGRIMTDSFGFRDYVLARRITDTPQGDFVADSRSVRDFPDAASWDELRAYLRRRHACREAIAAARCVWNAYLRQQHGSRRPYPPGAQAAPQQEETAR